MIEEAIGKVLGMALAYSVSALGLLLAYYNYRKRIMKAERVFTPLAIFIIVLLVALGGAGLAWLFKWEPSMNQSCVCVDVKNKDAKPLQGALVYAEGVTYDGNYEQKRTDEKGRSCITIRNSALTTQKVNVFVELKGDKKPYPENPVVAPQEKASCLKEVGCPEECKVLPQPVTMDYPDTRFNPTKLEDVKAAMKVKKEAKKIGIILPFIIFVFSFWVTWLLYRHFSRKSAEGKE
ncbi:MAG: hypothetical protein R6V10_13170 [bacterium]